MVGDAGMKSRIALKEPLHAIPISGEHHDEVFALRFHHLEQDLDSFLSVVALVLRAVEIVGLVDEQHAAHRLLQYLLGLRRGVADILTDKVVPSDTDDVAAADEAKPVEDTRDPERHRGLAGTWISGERHVQRRIRVGERHLPPDALDQEQRGDLPNPGFHRNQADQLAVELRQDRRDLDRLELPAQVDGCRDGIAVAIARDRPKIGMSHDCRSASIPVALTFRPIGGIGARGVAHVAADRFLPVESEARLVFRPIHDEGEPHRLPAMRRIERGDADVTVVIDAPAVVELFNDPGRVATAALARLETTVATAYPCRRQGAAPSRYASNARYVGCWSIGSFPATAPLPKGFGPDHPRSRSSRCGPRYEMSGSSNK